MSDLDLLKLCDKLIRNPNGYNEDSVTIALGLRERLGGQQATLGAGLPEASLRIGLRVRVHCYPGAPLATISAKRPGEIEYLLDHPIPNFPRFGDAVPTNGHKQYPLNGVYPLLSIAEAADTGRKPDSFHMHEALDRTHMASTLVQTMLIDHIGAKAVPEAYTKIEQAIGLLEEAYQIIGRVHLDNDETAT